MARIALPGVVLLLLFFVLTYGAHIPSLSVPEGFQATIKCDLPRGGRCSNLKTQVTKCDVIVLGAGAAGTFAALQLAKNHTVCVIEKLSIVGGRIQDAPAPFILPGESEPRVFGKCALRVNQNMTRLRCLANRLDIQLYLAPFETDQIRTRGETIRNFQELLPGGIHEDLYELNGQWSSIDDGWNYLLGYSRFNPSSNLTDSEGGLDYLEKAKAGGEFLRYCRQQLGSEGCQLIIDTNVGFFSDFYTGWDARNYVEGNRELYYWGNDFYPLGGMSQFPKRMEAKATEDGARFFKNETVRCLSKSNRAGKTVFRVITDKGVYEGNFLMNTIPTQQFEYIGGKLAIELTSQPQFRFLKFVEVVTIQIWWTERWWIPYQEQENVTFRAWSTENCFNRVDIADTPYTRPQNVTRSVYTDLQCVPFWKGAIARGPEEVEKEILNGLQQLFPEVVFPEIYKIETNVQPLAWVYVLPFSPYSVEDFREWAEEPLSGVPFCHAGESYDPYYFAWIEGSVNSVNRCLAKHFGFDYASSLNPCNLPLDRLWNVKLSNEF